ncbi:MAG: type I restriction endonuclease subunit R [Natronincolaceae bacterium]|nr:type I restriction endonuclease subunit R [Bacillota bacterium]
MGKILTEDMIEKACIDRLCPDKYDFIDAFIEPNKVFSRDNILEIEKDGTGRNNIKEVILPDILFKSLKEVNPQIPENILKDIVTDFRQYISNKDLKDTNYDNYKLIKDNIRVEYELNGKKKQDIVRLIAFNNYYRNTFTLVSQMWIKGDFGYRRPDLILFVNGLPLVFIELKNSDVKIKTAYDKNLKDYIRDIPQLFFFNQFCVLSNGTETRIGSFTAEYGHFFEWLRLSEEDRVDRKSIRKSGTSIEYLLDGLFDHETLLDYIENFILYENKREKIIAKNHQFLGINNAIDSFKNRKHLEGKLGVFWHTQGSGKSYSMGMFVNKINRKMQGNFSFLMVTDRVNLDDQLYKNFLRTEIITEEETARPENSEMLREDLTTSKAFIFTLIHKFRYDKGKKYPVLSERDDIIVIVDEAHRTQYKDLAENMRTALPNAGYIAFTGTPLLGSKRLTNQWFGDYVSEYNFAQSIEDGSTVPLYYSRRVPEVALINTDLDDDYLEIIEKENLTKEEEERLAKYYSQTTEVLKRDSRLDKVARDIVEHFPRRGYLGKAMVVSVDKFTTVKMYDKVNYYWGEKLKELIEKRSGAESEEDKIKIKNQIDYMKNIEMAVVISEDSDEEEKFKKEGLDISKHRARMKAIDENGHDIEDNFKDPDHPLSLVFLCAMWLTGFDVPSVSTLYLDKPMKGHTLMQAIARVNRVYPGKNSGLIVDYLNLFKSMKTALGDYANPDNEEEVPVKNIEAILELLDNTIDEAKGFCKGLNIDFDKILETGDVFPRISIFKEYLNILLDKDEYKEEFKIYSNLCRNTYDASKPEVFEMGWENKYLSIIIYLDDMLRAAVRDESIENAKIELGRTLDLSVKAESIHEDAELGDYDIKVMETLNLSEIDTKDIKRKIDSSPYKNIEIQELRSFIEDKLEKLLEDNKTRISFAERYRAIIDNYNAGNSKNENFYEDLIDFVDDLKEESERHVREGLSEKELEIFDLLKKENLTKKEEQQVKLSAKKLYETITKDDSATKIVDWYKDEQPRWRVRSGVEEVLDEFLPQSYSKDMFNIKTDIVFAHIVEEAMKGRQYAS